VYDHRLREARLARLDVSTMVYTAGISLAIGALASRFAVPHAR
jgi:hypothetical protein